MTSTSETPAGWHPDPTGQFEQRYWDGTQWTEHVHAAGVQSVSPLPTAPQEARQEEAQYAEQSGHAEQSAYAEQSPFADVSTVADQATVADQPESAAYDLGSHDDSIPMATPGFQPVQSEPAQFQAIPVEPIQVELAAIQPEPIRLEPIQVQAQPEQAQHEQAQHEQAQQPEQVQQAQQVTAQPVVAGPPADWHPDPSGQFEQRYWDGSQWTEHVAHQGQQGVSPLSATRPVTTSSPDQVQRQVQHQAGVGTSYGGGGHLLDEPLLVVNQKAKLIEVTQEFAVYDQAGNQLGSVVQVGQNVFRKFLRLATSYDQYLTHKFEVRDQQGAIILTLVRPAKFMKSKVIVGGPTGQEIGQIRQENVLGKIRFAFEVGGQRIGGIQAENWRAWNFSIVDAGGQEVARITKTWEGVLKAAFTTADNYVIQIHHRLPEPLRSLVVASALTVDTALKQDSRGLGA